MCDDTQRCPFFLGCPFLPCVTAGVSRYRRLGSQVGGRAAARRVRWGGSEGVGRSMETTQRCTTALIVGLGGKPRGCKLKVWAKLEGH